MLKEKKELKEPETKQEELPGDEQFILDEKKKRANISPEDYPVSKELVSDEFKDIELSDRATPVNELDLQMQLVEPGWQNLSPQLRTLLIRKVNETVQETKEGIVRKEFYEELSGILAVYTRDIRLGNLSQWSGEYERSEEHTSELQSHSFISYAVCGLKKKKNKKKKQTIRKE